MIFNVKSINTVYIAGKEVDGMKRPREPPTGGNKMNIGRILPTEAAAILNVSPQFVRVAIDDVKTVYHKEFDEALEEYNKKQTRPDRKIEDYF